MEEFYFYTRGLTVGYHGVPLIKDIELCLKKGEIMTLIGPNGAGKTTILKSIIRQLKPLGGVACLDGSSMEKLTGKELSQKLSDDDLQGCSGNRPLSLYRKIWHPV